MTNETHERTNKKPGVGDDIKTYIENRIELVSLNIAEHIADAISSSVQRIAGLILLSCGGLFLWIALGFFLGDLLNNLWLGFLLASIPLFFVGLIFYYNQAKSIDAKIKTDIIKKISVRFDDETEQLSRKLKKKTHSE